MKKGLIDFSGATKLEFKDFGSDKSNRKYIKPSDFPHLVDQIQKKSNNPDLSINSNNSSSPINNSNNIDSNLIDTKPKENLEIISAPNNLNFDEEIQKAYQKGFEEGKNSSNNLQEEYKNKLDLIFNVFSSDFSEQLSTHFANEFIEKLKFTINSIFQNNNPIDEKIWINLFNSIKTSLEPEQIILNFKLNSIDAKNAKNALLSLGYSDNIILIDDSIAPSSAVAVLQTGQIKVDFNKKIKDALENVNIWKI